LYFASMLTSTGGNTSSQTSAMVIQGLALGDIQPANMFRFLRREFLMACMIGGILGCTAFMRVYLTTYNPLEAFAISLSLAVIVIVSVVFGSCITLVLRRFNIDPAFSAGPFLATLMDILGALIYCYVARLILSP
ncbi:MAG: magnesium transporter, partial [Candidatus Paceibacterales bacterium]